MQHEGKLAERFPVISLIKKQKKPQDRMLFLPVLHPLS